MGFLCPEYENVLNQSNQKVWPWTLAAVCSLDDFKEEDGLEVAYYRCTSIHLSSPFYHSVNVPMRNILRKKYNHYAWLWLFIASTQLICRCTCKPPFNSSPRYESQSNDE